jgi:hypothetical protein
MREEAIDKFMRVLKKLKNLLAGVGEVGQSNLWRVIGVL